MCLVVRPYARSSREYPRECSTFRVIRDSFESRASCGLKADPSRGKQQLLCVRVTALRVKNRNPRRATYHARSLVPASRESAVKIKGKETREGHRRDI